MNSKHLAARGRATIPDQRGRLLAEAQDEVVHPIAIEVAYHRAGLLFGSTGRGGDLTPLARQVLPAWVRSSEGDGQAEPETQHDWGRNRNAGSGGLVLPRIQWRLHGS